MKATKDNATYTEKVVLQDNLDTDFEKVTDTTVNYIPNEIPLLDTTTDTQIESKEELVENDKVLLIDAANDITDVTLGSVTTGNMDDTHTLDTFGDGSGVACYLLDGDANDSSGNYNSIWSGTEQYDTGKFGQAAKFDGNSHIKLPLNDILGDFLKYVSVWFNLTNEISENKVIFQMDQNDSGWTNFQIGIDSNYKLYIGGRGDDHSNASYQQAFNANNAITINKWYHLVLNKINNTTYNVYLDNNLIGSFDFTFYAPTNSYRQGMGAFINSSDDSDIRNAFLGLIDQVRIFNRVLTADEVNKLYNEQKTKYIGDISSANLLELPAKAFKKQLPSVSIAVEATETDITDTSFNELTPKTTTYDGAKFTTVYATLEKQGRAIQRKLITSKSGMQILTPFTSHLYKKG